MDETILIAGVPIAVIVTALVELAKRLGVPSKWAPVVSIGFGVLIAVMAVATDTWPTIRPWWEAVVAGVLIGLTASGIYSGYKTVTGQNTEEKVLAILQRYGVVQRIEKER